jgi:PrtD family type I secretion system ABC transporter
LPRLQAKLVVKLGVQVVPVPAGLALGAAIASGAVGVGDAVDDGALPAGALHTMTLLTERASRAPARAAAQDAGSRSIMVEAQRRSGETILAMGMTGALARRWNCVNDRYIAAVGRLSDIAGSFGSVSKVLRLLLQSVILGLGAYLVLRVELTAGGMIAASIMMGRALAPIETAIANWRSFVAARQSIKRLSETLARAAPAQAATTLPKPSRTLVVEQVTVVAPGATKPIVTGVRFGLKAGEVLGIIGPSGAGKTSLVRALVGIWRPAKGSVRLDGAALDQWDRELLGRHIGFISQTVELFDGTIAENIARMAIAPDADAVLRAARAAGAHDMILRLASGYDTPIGEGGEALSAGQRQRIALARALYGGPKAQYPTSIRYRVQTIIDLMVRLTEAGYELRVAPARLRLRSGALRIASDINLIDHILPWVVLLLGLSLPSLAVLLLG